MSTTLPQSNRAPSIHELDGLLGFIPGAGPPAVLLVGPLVLFALAVAGPFLVIVTLAVAVFAVVAIVALAGLVLATPYLVVRHVRAAHVPRVAAPSTVWRAARPHARRVAA
jgi:hypothetical protein